MQNAGSEQQRILGTVIGIVHMENVGSNILKPIKIKKSYKERRDQNGD